MLARNTESDIDADREAVEEAKQIVRHQDVILDKIEYVRWFFEKAKDVGDVIKEVSNSWMTT